MFIALTKWMPQRAFMAWPVIPWPNRIRLQGARILVLGAGGAARAAVFGLKERGAEVSILNRTAAAAQKLAKQAKAKVINRTMLKKLEFDVIINATPAGMEGNKDPLPLTEPEMKAKYFFEMVYTPAETKMIRMARASLRSGPASPPRCSTCSASWTTHSPSKPLQRRRKPAMGKREVSKTGIAWV